MSALFRGQSKANPNLECVGVLIVRDGHVYINHVTDFSDAAGVTEEVEPESVRFELPINQKHIEK